MMRSAGNQKPIIPILSTQKVREYLLRALDAIASGDGFGASASAFDKRVVYLESVKNGPVNEGLNEEKISSNLAKELL